MYRGFISLKEKKKMTRTDARELLMQMLYSMKIQNDYSKERKDYFLKEKKLGNQKEYIDKMHELITEHMTEIDEKYEALETGWKLNRLSAVDLSIIRVAMAEILYTDEIAKGVAINEAVELAKKFSSDKSASFINAVLAKVDR